VGDRRYPILMALNLVAAAHCMVAQMALAVTLSFVAGHSVTVFAVFVGLYLAAMGGGVLAVERFSANTSDWLTRLLLLLTVAAFAASPGVPALMLAHESGGGIAVWILGIALSLILGGVAGAFLPVVSKVAEAESWPAARPLIAALTSEYAGAFLGCVTFALLLYPHVGLVHAVVLSQAMAILVVNLAAVALGVARRRPARALPLLLLLDAWVAASLSFQDEFVTFLDRLPG
jgi:spermidine synthase